MKKCPLTVVGAFLLLVVAFLVAMGNFKKPQTQHTTSNPHGSLIKTVQEKVPQEQEEKKYQVSIQLDPVFPDSE